MTEHDVQPTRFFSEELLRGALESADPYDLEDVEVCLCNVVLTEFDRVFEERHPRHLAENAFFFPQAARELPLLLYRELAFVERRYVTELLCYYIGMTRGFYEKKRVGDSEGAHTFDVCRNTVAELLEYVGLGDERDVIDRLWGLATPSEDSS